MEDLKSFSEETTPKLKAEGLVETYHKRERRVFQRQRAVRCKGLGLEARAWSL